MTAPELLRKIKALIADEANWWDGKGPKPENVRCSLGAMLVFINEDTSVRNEAATILRSVIGGRVGSITQFNDTHSHAEVMQAFDRAIELAERQGAA